MNKKQELQQIYQRFFNSPAPIDTFNRARFNKNMASKKYSKRPGTVIWDNGTFRGNLKQTFKF